MTREELLSPGADPVEAAEETTLRPRSLAEFVGQPKLVEHLFHFVVLLNSCPKQHSQYLLVDAL